MELPSISIIIPTYNEEEFLDGCVNSLLNGNYPIEKIEVLVIDGISTDRTVQVAETLHKTYGNITIIPNTKKIVPAALNLGVSNASYDLILWAGAHATYSTNYVSGLVACLKDPECASAGGILTSVGRTKFAKSIAVATNSRFGVGVRKYRHATTKQAVDSVFGGCWRKEDFLAVGGFNENWVRNQDYEFNLRLRDSIGKIILDPNITCSYYCRETIYSLGSQYFQYGFWRLKTIYSHPQSLSLRLVAPAALVTALATSILVAPFYSKIAAITPSIYLSTVLVISTYIGLREKRPRLTADLISIFPTIHISWGLGFVFSLIKMSVTRSAN